MSTKITIFAIICVVIVTIRNQMLRNLENTGPSQYEIVMGKMKEIKDKIMEKKDGKEKV